MFLVPFLLSLSTADAFCGTYVASAGTEVFNSLSEVVMARVGDTTTLTIANDVVGDPSQFAMVIPVPQALGPDDVHVAKRSDFDLLRTYSMPRLVEYVCTDFKDEAEHPCPWVETPCATDFANGSAAGTDGADGSGGSFGGGYEGVSVEAQYAVGEYAVTVLSATESKSLLSWLEDHGYAVGADKAAVLQEYIDADSYFLAAEVSEDAGLTSGDTLSPLQFTYRTPVFGLPIRIGTASSTGVQDVILYTITTQEGGRTGISNYPEFAVEDECLSSAARVDLSGFYGAVFQKGYEETPGGAWTTEYGWLNVPTRQKCDPCTGPPPEEQQLANLGFRGSLSAFYVTRLHLRYTPEEATQDVVLYESGLTDRAQVRYIDYDPSLEDRFPICLSGWASNPGTCEVDEIFADVDCVSRSAKERMCEKGTWESRGCTSAPAGPVGWGALLVGLAPLLVRRRA